ncbi:MAG: aminotransferase class IV [Deltaproteobacteria bacterium]|jgi:4-amino-4-deoxychorismate lyase|nr:aminotransferase class IV [Deltaproteobacteria bacterium]
MAGPVFLESIRLLDGAYQDLFWHQKRILRTCRAFFGQPPGFDLEAVLPVPPTETGLFKARLLYSLETTTVEIKPYVIKAVYSLELVEGKDLAYGHKFLDRSAIDSLKAKSRADDIIVVQGGLLTDTSIANLVLESGEGLFTPERCLLPGVKRDKLMSAGVLRARAIRVQDLGQYSRIWLINAMIDLEDRVGIGTGDVIGPKDGWPALMPPAPKDDGLKA